MDSGALPRSWLLRALELEPARGEDPVEAGRNTLRAFLDAVQEAWAPDGDPLEVASMLEAYAQRLGKARPSDASFQTGLSVSVAAMPLGREAVLEAGNRFLLQAEANETALLDVASGLIGPGTRVLTLGRPRLVEKLLLRYADRLESVTVSEGRPDCEGAQLAGKLAAQTIPVRLVTEAQLDLIAGECDLALVGARRVLPDGSVVGPVGTAVVARVCQSAQVPFYVLAGTDLWVADGAELAHFEWERGPASDVLATAPRGVQVLNVRCDLTPADLMTGYVTEEEIRYAGDVTVTVRKAA